MYLKREFFVLTALLTVCQARIKLEITLPTSYKNITLRGHGVDKKLVTEKEVNTFNITSDNLKEGVRVELGSKPEDVFLKDPTPYKNLYEIYNWPQVTRILKVDSIKVVDVAKRNKVLTVCKYINNTTESSFKVKPELFKSVEHSVSSTWSARGIPNDNILYDIDLKFTNAVLHYENKWRHKVLRDVFAPFGVSKHGYVEIEPGQTVLFKLSATRVTVLVDVDYIANLDGDVIANYKSLYGKYHFYSPTVESIMKAADLKNEIVTTETIEINCYTDPKLKIYNDVTGESLMVVKPPETPLRQIKFKTGKKTILN